VSLGRTGRPRAEKDSEFICDVCGARCTRTVDHGEVGHKYGCPERPDHLPQWRAAGPSTQYQESE